MNREALERLADKLEGKGAYAAAGPVPDGKFDMGDWMNVRLTEFRPEVIQSCGFAACACGWASTDPWFVERGFDHTFGIFAAGNTGWYRVSTFFGLTFDDAEHLFDGAEYRDEDNYPLDNVTPAMVAGRIRAFLADG